MIDRQDDLREGGGRQVLPLARQLLDQLFEPRIVPDDHHGLGVLPYPLQQREDVGRASQIKMRVQQDLSCIASRLGHRFSRQPRPHRVGGDDNIGCQSVLPHQLSHPRGILPATLVQRPLVVIERRIVPTRLGVPENQQSLHPQKFDAFDVVDVNLGFLPPGSRRVAYPSPGLNDLHTIASDPSTPQQSKAGPAARQAMTQPAFKADTPTVLFEGRFPVDGPGRAYDVTSDGQRFLMTQSHDRAPIDTRRIVLVQNWTEELKRLVPTN